MSKTEDKNIKSVLKAAVKLSQSLRQQRVPPHVYEAHCKLISALLKLN
jgi:hypothetical protein